MVWLQFLACIFLSPLTRLIPNLRARRSFEYKNLLDHSSRPFSLDGLIADYCFEVSSEGEFEQSYPLIRNALAAAKKVELIYCSPSVEHKVKKLISDSDENLLRTFRLPLLTLNLFKDKQSVLNWATAKTLILCRYDFFPELMEYGRKKDVHFILNSALMKCKEHKKSYIQDLKSFDLIIAANKNEERLLRKFFPNKEIESFDFRIPQIRNRLKDAEAVLSSHQNVQLKNCIESYNQRIILGSYWPEDKLFFTDDVLAQIKSKELLVVICPHNLKEKSITRVQSEIVDLGLKTWLDSEIGSLKSEGGVLIVTLKGILCELYTLFDCAYVSGGFGRSIHSVLEPWMSQTKIICGPKIHRSSEFDFIKAETPTMIEVVETPDLLFKAYTELNTKDWPKPEVIERISAYLNKQEKILKAVFKNV